MILWSVLFRSFIGYMLSLSVNDSMMLVVSSLSIMIQSIIDFSFVIDVFSLVHVPTWFGLLFTVVVPVCFHHLI